MHETLRYGSLPGQEGDLYLPARGRASVICLLHGGFWRMPHGREQLADIAEDLQRRGFAVWNLEYRRIGQAGAGWRGTFDDVLAGIDFLVRFDTTLDLDRVILCGHSAGGHLALWAAAQWNGRSGRGVRVRVAVGQAPLADLARAHALGLGNGAVAELLGGEPGRLPELFATASPHALLPLSVPQLIIQGTADEVVPPGLARNYVEDAQRAGDVIELCEVPGSGHMEFLDPGSRAHSLLCDRLPRLAGAS